MKKERAALSLRGVENRKSYKILRDFILEEGMKAVNLESTDFLEKTK